NEYPRTNIFLAIFRQSERIRRWRKVYLAHTAAAAPMIEAIWHASRVREAQLGPVKQEAERDGRPRCLRRTIPQLEVRAKSAQVDVHDEVPPSRADHASSSKFPMIS